MATTNLSPIVILVNEYDVSKEFKDGKESRLIFAI